MGIFFCFKLWPQYSDASVFCLYKKKNGQNKVMSHLDGPYSPLPRHVETRCIAHAKPAGISFSAEWRKGEQTSCPAI